jgi:Uma2 family endonuclease
MNAPFPRADKPLPLQTGDRLTRAEFERRYEAMPQVKKAELIEGEVFMPSPVSFVHHGMEDGDFGWFLKHYTVFTPGTSSGGNATIRLDTANEPQPDVTLIIDPAAGGRVVIDEDGYITGAPELVGEVSGSTASIDLGRKMTAYRRNQVSEYLVWRVFDAAVDWFILRDGQFDRLPPDADGLFKSVTFPGLWLDPAALVRRDLAAVLAALARGLATPEHAAFVERLRAAGPRPG